jgi:hypothetical protein
MYMSMKLLNTQMNADIFNTESIIQMCVDRNYHMCHTAMAPYMQDAKKV